MKSVTNFPGAAFSLALLFSLILQPLNSQILIDPATEQKIDALIEKMTLEEKAGQLNQYSSTFDVTGPAPEAGSNKLRYEQITQGLVGSMLNVVGAEATRQAQQLAVENSRLGIPLIFGYDVIHGFKTIFPIPLAEAASWDPEAMEASARVAAVEASAAGLHWTFAPMVDIARDARWGRIMEGSGEDPYLGSVAAVARVRGFQGDDLSASNTIAACAKHYAAYGFAEGGRDYNTVDISRNTLHNIVLPPFKAAAEAGVATFMNAFNEIGGVPATASIYLQRDILKEKWGFEGLVVSDWNSIGELIIHGVAADREEAARLAITAGSDMDMETAAYVNHLPALVRSGAVDEAVIDDAVRRVLRVKFALGLFDDPYRYCDAEREASQIYTDAHLAVARDVARKSIVLLKNEDQLLPLSKRGRIAVLGPLADDKDTPLGSWRGQGVANSAVSLLEGIRAAVGDAAEVVHAPGMRITTGDRSFTADLTFAEPDRSGFQAAVETARGADVVVIALGEEAFQTGEGRSQTDIGLRGLQLELLQEVYAVNDRVVLVLMNGRPLELAWPADNVPAILETWHLGSMAGHAIADVLFGDYNPSGKLPVSFPYAVGQEPLYYNHKNTGRPTGAGNSPFWSHYTDAPNVALYPFGYGLSYTEFFYSEIEMSADELRMDGELDVSIRIKNTGDRAGTEVVQLYIRDMVGTVTRPVIELKAFQRVELEPGQSKNVTFHLFPSDLAFYNRTDEWTAEPGAFKVFVGSNSRDVKEADFRLVK